MSVHHSVNLERVAIPNPSTAAGNAAPARFLGARFDLVPRQRVLQMIAERRADDAFAYVVTPNVDHVVRLAQRPELHGIYDQAWMSVCDSKPIGLLARLFGLRLPHITGSDLTADIMQGMIAPGDRVALIAAHSGIADDLAKHFPATSFVEHVPPMGFISNQAAVAAALDFVNQTPARFYFIGIGAPQSEQFAAMIAAANAAGGTARGTAFCTGAALEFVTGRKRRAPVALQAIGLEWAFRAATEPRRLWKRYAASVVPLLGLTIKELQQRRRGAPPPGGRGGNMGQSS